ncbi:MAG TPA: cation-translocating P-type ATPase [Candidatus Akkermansia intestinigallinarum]|uniref:P-type Zn(2+) transporter n=1 Tax=Candidatus Akkermansia intestinigallinarum TaxID=2838431 RepID=A0A9D1VAU2_9BACT|nr:cation-translocating P-type ATPase [Candidatus Akkermansia intestinigallinarum]
MQLLKSIQTWKHRLDGWKVIGLSALCLGLSLWGSLGGPEALIPLAWGSVLLNGVPILIKASEVIFLRRRLNAAVLTSLGMVASLTIGQYFAAGEIALIMAIGEMLERGTLSRARRGLRELLALSPDLARRLRTAEAKRACCCCGSKERRGAADARPAQDTAQASAQEPAASGSCCSVPTLADDAAAARRARAERSAAPSAAADDEELVPTDSLRCGDRLRVRPGECIPADGVIRKGESTVDQSILTGEPMPLDKGVNDTVFAGCINGAGCLEIEVTRDASDSSLKRLIRLVQEAGEKQAPIQREADRWAQWLIPFAMLLALAGFIALRFNGYGYDEALLRAVTVLVVFCPCSLVLATPTSIAAAIGQATRHGVIIKSGEALEVLGRVDTIAFDKTGTLTCGRPETAEVISTGSLSRDELLRTAAALETGSEHPLAQAIVRAASGSGKLPAAEHFRATAGRGVEAEISGRRWLCGSEAALIENGVALSDEQRAKLDELRRRGMATVLLGSDGRLEGLLALCDNARAETRDVLAELTQKRIMLTGDHETAARRLAADVGIDSVHASLLPGDKAALIESLQKQGHRVAMVGDGINDAPALKTAQVGIAMSKPGSDIATEAADVALMQNDLARLPYLMRLGRATINTIRFNIALSLTINIIAVTMSLMGLLNPITGALVHNAGSVLVVFNAALLFDRRFDTVKKKAQS